MAFTLEERIDTKNILTLPERCYHGVAMVLPCEAFGHAKRATFAASTVDRRPFRQTQLRDFSAHG